MFDWAAVASVLCLAGMFTGFCIAVARAFFSKHLSRARYRMAALWAVSLVAAALFGQIASDTLGAKGPFIAVALVVLFAAVLLSSIVLARYWETKDVLASVAYLQMSRKPTQAEGPETPTPAEDGASDSPLASRDAADDATALSSVQSSEPKLICAMAARTYDLTRREEEVLLLLLEGKSFAAIAGELFVSENTVKTHVRHIYRKMGVNRKQDLARRVYS